MITPENGPGQPSAFSTWLAEIFAGTQLRLWRNCLYFSVAKPDLDRPDFFGPVLDLEFFY